MNKEIKKLIDKLEISVDSVPELPYFSRLTLPDQTKSSGVYVLTDRNRIQYVGRANYIRSRVQQHSRPSSGHNAASFAYILAKKKYGVKKASYITKGARSELIKDSNFLKHFKDAKKE